MKLRKVKQFPLGKTTGLLPKAEIAKAESWNGIEAEEEAEEEEDSSNPGAQGEQASGEGGNHLL